MWALAYGLIALAVVAFVVMYAAYHTPLLHSVNLAEQLYQAKSAFRDPSALHKTANVSEFNIVPTGVFVKVVKVPIRNPPTGVVEEVPVDVPLAYKVSAEVRNVRYQVYAELLSCRNATTARGEPGVLYEIKLLHSIDALPWLEAHALVPTNASGIYEYYLKMWIRHNRTDLPQALPLWGDPSLVKLGYAALVKAEKAAVFGPTTLCTHAKASAGLKDAHDWSHFFSEGRECKISEWGAVVYVVAPSEAVAVYLVDYPAQYVFACVR
ncbi:MAG: hypothetical protein ABWK05_08440 [Pyrobaculum sp.]